MTFKTFTPSQYLLIDLANQNGQDKLSYEDRIAHAKKLLSGEETPSPENPHLYLKCFQAIQDTKQGKPIHHPVHFDSASSGLQIMSVMTGCVSGCKMTGLIDPDTRSDAYSVVMDALNAHLIGQGYQEINVTRNDAKQAVMTSLYGSVAKPEEIFGEEIAKEYTHVMHNIAPGAMQLLNLLKNAWGGETTGHAWSLPDGHVAYVPVLETVEHRINISRLKHQPVALITENVSKDKGISLIANVIHSVDAFILRELIRRTNHKRYNLGRIKQQLQSDKEDFESPEYKQWLAFKFPSMRYLDGDVSWFPKPMKVAMIEMINTINYESFETLTVHDSFACLPTNLNYLRKQYANIMADLALSTIAQELLQQLYKDTAPYDKLCDDKALAAIIRESNYGLS